MIGSMLFLHTLIKGSFVQGRKYASGLSMVALQAGEEARQISLDRNVSDGQSEEQTKKINLYMQVISRRNFLNDATPEKNETCRFGEIVL